MTRILSLIAGVTGFGAIGSGLVATGGLLALVGSLWFGFAWHYESKGAVKAAAQIEKKAVALNEKGLKARASVSGIDNPAGRLLGKYCRDC